MPPRKPTGVDLLKNRNGSTSYRIRWRQGGGRDGAWGSHSFGSRQAAIDALRSIEAAGWQCYCPKHCPPGVEAGEYGAPGETKPLTWGEYAHEQITHRTGIGKYYRSRFIRELQLHYEPLLDLDFNEVDRDAVQRWLRGLERKGLSPVTIRRLLVQAGSVQAAAVDAGLSERNPFTRQRIGRRDSNQHEEMVILSHAEWARLQAALPAGPYRDLCTTLVGTGMRFGEATALPVGAVNLAVDPPRLHVVQAWKADGANGYELGTPKSQRSRRTITFGAAVVEAIRPHLAGKRDAELVFTTPAGAPIRTANFRHRMWLPACAAAGLARRPRVHDLRHTHVSWLIAAGRPVPGISRRLGHESITTTIDRYGHLLPDVDVADVAALDEAMPLTPPEGEGLAG
jgi:integrase